MTGTVETVLHGICDRCATAFTRPVQYPLHAVLTTEPESDDFEDPWVFELVNDCADLDDIVTTTFVLNMDSKLLCSEDCKGLCSRCGANLNLGTCGAAPTGNWRSRALLLARSAASPACLTEHARLAAITMVVKSFLLKLSKFARYENEREAESVSLFSC